MEMYYVLFGNTRLYVGYCLCLETYMTLLYLPPSACCQMPAAHVALHFSIAKTIFGWCTQCAHNVYMVVCISICPGRGRRHPSACGRRWSVGFTGLINIGPVNRVLVVGKYQFIERAYRVYGSVYAMV